MEAAGLEALGAAQHQVLRADAQRGCDLMGRDHFQSNSLSSWEAGLAVHCLAGMVSTASGQRANSHKGSANMAYPPSDSWVISLSGKDTYRTWRNLLNEKKIDDRHGFIIPLVPQERGLISNGDCRGGRVPPKWD